MTATYWEIGRRIVEFEQQGQERAEYREAVIKQLAGDLGSSQLTSRSLTATAI